MTKTLDKNIETPTNGVKRHRMTVDEFERAFFAGAFGTRRLELIEGELIEMSPMGNKHYAYLIHFNKQLVLAYHGKAEIISQSPLKLDDSQSQPEPDFVVIPKGLYSGEIVFAKDTALVIEISDSTLEFDRGEKLAIYARNGVREYWIVNIAAKQLEVYRDPSEQTYKTKNTLEVGQTVSPQEFKDTQIEWWI